MLDCISLPGYHVYGAMRYPKQQDCHKWVLLVRDAATDTWALGYYNDESYESIFEAWPVLQDRPFYAFAQRCQGVVERGS